MEQVNVEEIYKWEIYRLCMGITSKQIRKRIRTSVQILYKGYTHTYMLSGVIHVSDKYKINVMV